jgi:hypothetical protein
MLAVPRRPLSPGRRRVDGRVIIKDSAAKGTIERAYELLEADTVIEMRGREGSFVLERMFVDGQSSIRTRSTRVQLVRR